MSARWRRTLPCPLSTPPRRCTPSPTWNSVITRHRALAAVRIYRVTRILYRTKLPRLGVPPSCPRSLPTYALMSKAERYWSHQLSMPWKFNRLWSHHLPIKVADAHSQVPNILWNPKSFVRWGDVRCAHKLQLRISLQQPAHEKTTYFLLPWIKWYKDDDDEEEKDDDDYNDMLETLCPKIPKYPLVLWWFKPWKIPEFCLNKMMMILPLSTAAEEEAAVSSSNQPIN